MLGQELIHRKVGGQVWYFKDVHMRISFDGLAVMVGKMQVGDIIVADNTAMTKRKIYRVLAREKAAILYLRTTPKEKFLPLADNDGKISIKNLTLLSEVLLQLEK